VGVSDLGSPQAADPTDLFSFAGAAADEH
jgi:hypothetical protein